MRYSAHLESTKRLAAALQLFQLEQTRWITILGAKLEIPIVAEIRRVGHRRGHDVSDEECAKDRTLIGLGQKSGDVDLLHENTAEALSRTLCAGLLESNLPKANGGEAVLGGLSQTRTGTTRRIASIGLAFCIELSFLISSGQMRLSQPLISPGDKVCILAGGQNAVYPS
jgi:hypothetical protein